MQSSSQSTPLITPRPDRPVMLIGCGRMGTALVYGWIRRGLLAKAAEGKVPSGEGPKEIRGGLANQGTTFPLVILNPSERPQLIADAPKGAILHITKFSEWTGPQPHTIILAVKPDKVAEVTEPFQNQENQGLWISLAAGLGITRLKVLLGSQARIIRAMPNTPSRFGMGMTVLATEGAPSSSNDDLEFARVLFDAVGETAVLSSERDLDIATAISGSGPAYFFLLIECLEQQARIQGLNEDLARKLVRQTARGAATMALNSSQEAAQLRQEVTSKGGVTEAAVSELISARGLPILMRQAIASGVRRAREMGETI